MKISYSTWYNFRPGEGYGMGKESLKVTGEWESLEEFMKTLEYNSSLKHKDNKEWIVGTEDFVENDEWTKWIGQPMFFIYDIEIEGQ